jgi:glucose-1-phosphate adenylyltransferase
LMMGSDFYQNLEELQRDEARGYPRVGLGRNCNIRRAIIDKNARIGSGVQIVNEAGVKDFDGGDQYSVRDGIVIVPKNAVIEDGTVI